MTEPAGEPVCIDNIGPRGRRLRFLGGLLGYLATAAIAAWLHSAGVTGAPWLGLFAPLLGAGVGVFESLERT